MIRIRRNQLPKVVTILALLVFSFFALMPFYIMIVMGTYSTQNLHKSITFLPGDYFLENIKTVLSSGFLRYYWNSFLISSLGTASCVFICALAGYGFAKFQFRWHRGLFALVIASLMVPHQLGLIGYVIEMRYLGLSGSYLSIILAYIPNCFGVFWMTQYIKSSLSDSILESARIDGCPEVTIFFRIVLPCIMPAIGTLTILEYMWCWNDYLLPLVLLNRPKLFTIPLGIAALGTRYQTNYAAQICGLVLGTIPVIAVFLVAAKSFIKGITAGAVKG